MKIYKIKIDEKVYEVEVEQVTEVDGSIEINSENEYRNSNKSESNKSASSGTEVKAPLQASVFTINVIEGENIKKGDILMVLEAMKLENEILSPVDGIVRQVNVSKSENVDAGDVLVVID